MSKSVSNSILTKAITQMYARKLKLTPLPIRLLVLAGYSKVVFDGMNLIYSSMTESTRNFLKLYKRMAYSTFKLAYFVYFVETWNAIAFGWMSMHNMPLHKFLEHHGIVVIITVPYFFCKDLLTLSSVNLESGVKDQAVSATPKFGSTCSNNTVDSTTYTRCIDSLTCSTPSLTRTKYTAITVSLCYLEQTLEALHVLRTFVSSPDAYMFRILGSFLGTLCMSATSVTGRITLIAWIRVLYLNWKDPGKDTKSKLIDLSKDIPSLAFMLYVFCYLQPKYAAMHFSKLKKALNRYMYR